MEQPVEMEQTVEQPETFHRIVFLDRDTVEARFRPPAFPHAWVEHARTSATEVLPRLRKASVAITNKVPLPGSVVGKLPDLRAIMVAATGVDHIDVAACGARGIVVSNVRGYAAFTVAEHAILMMLALRRNILAYRDTVKGGAWQRADRFSLFVHPIEDLRGTTLGIVGFGATGQAIARLGEAFGMEVQVAEHKGRTIPRPGRRLFEEVIVTSDILSLSAPLVPETRGMIGERELASMKRSAILVNTARGGLVDEVALDRALRTGVIAGAGLDVLAKEPPTEGSSLLDEPRPNLLITPHVAWASRSAMQRLADQLVDNLEAFARGAPVHVVGNETP